MGVCVSAREKHGKLWTEKVRVHDPGWDRNLAVDNAATLQENSSEKKDEGLRFIDTTFIVKCQRDFILQAIQISSSCVCYSLTELHNAHQPFDTFFIYLFLFTVLLFHVEMINRKCFRSLCLFWETKIWTASVSHKRDRTTQLLLPASLHHMCFHLGLLCQYASGRAVTQPISWILNIFVQALAVCPAGRDPSA